MTRIFIVDDHAVLAEGLSTLLESEPGFAVVGHSLNAAGCLQFFEQNSADVLLMDIGLPDMNGVELCTFIKKQFPLVQVIALSTLDEGIYISKMLNGGASGYLLKNAGRKEITEAIHEVMRGREYLSKEVAKALANFHKQQETIPILTKREKEVLVEIVKGLTSAEIASNLFISTDTVESHRKHLHTKLQVKNTAQLVRYAIEHKLY